MRKSNIIVSTAVFIILVFFVFSSVALLTGRPREAVGTTQDGYVDLTDFNFNGKLAYVSHSNFLYYKGALYTPEDFIHGRVKQNPIALAGIKGRFDPGNYGTYRIILKLPGNGTYGISSYSAMYSQRLFINGTEYPAFGVPGKTAETTVSRTGHYTIYFTPRESQTEIIIQFANFHHYDYGGIVQLYLGTQERIIERDAVAQQRIHILVGCVITAFLFFLGMFFFFHKRYAFLWFSLACLSIGIRMLIVEEKVIMLLFPDLLWKLSIGMEYLSLIMLLFTFLLYIHNMFKGALYKPVLRAYGALCALFAAAVLLTPPVIYTRFMLWFELCSVLFGIYVLAALIYNIAYKKHNRYAEHALVLTGALIFIILSILNIQIHRSSGHNSALGLSETGMLILIFTDMIALALQFSRTENELDEARRSEREMQETNRLLDRMSRLKSDFQANVSHEMRTPLTIMASYADLTAMQIRRDAIDDKTLDNLATVKREAIRLAGLVEQLKEVSLEKERQLALADVEASFLLQQAAAFCEPICVKNRNRLSISAYSGKVLLHVNAESIFQTLVNLIVNANRHTKEGVICLSVRENNPESPSDYVEITVSDNGDGIDPMLIPRLFERGFSGDGSSGLGLAICKEIIKEHGGEIWVESEEGKGTAIRFTLPCRKGDGQHEKGDDTDH